jgi:hypothetical protein
MNKLENNLMNGTQTTAKKILDFLIGFLGSLIVGNIGIVLLAQFDTPELWGINFTRFWRLAFAGLAIFIFTKKRAWISLGIVTAVLLQAFEI